MSSAATDFGIEDGIDADSGDVVPQVAGVRAGAVLGWLGTKSARARRHALTPPRVSTAKPSGNASARACRAA
jgi:hypothetical protein